MIGRVVEIASEGCHLARKRGLLTVMKDGVEQGRIPLDDIEVLLCNARGLTYSHSLMLELASRNVPVLLCGTNYHPEAWLWPLNGHHAQALRMRCQIEAKLPLRKRLWQSVVKAKLSQQVNVLRAAKLPTNSIEGLIGKVRSGDPKNVEAQAARHYWPMLFGKSFRRGRYEGGPNSLLNYGYAVLRGSVARAVVSAGLHPSIGIHHTNRTNSMCLVDDLIEPFRPVVDHQVLALVKSGQNDVVPETKQALAQTLSQDMITERGTTPLQTCITRAAQSLAQSFESGTPDLVFPGRPVPGVIQSFNWREQDANGIQTHVDDGAVRPTS